MAKREMYKHSHLAVISEINTKPIYDEFVYFKNGKGFTILAYKGHNQKVGDTILISKEFVIHIRDERHMALVWEIRGVLMHLKHNSDAWLKRLVCGREINKLCYKHIERMRDFKTVGGL